MFKKLNKKQLTLLLVSSLVISLIFAILYLYSVINDTVLFVGCIIAFLIMSFALNEVTARIVSKKFEKKFSNPKIYCIEDDLEVSLKGISCSKLNFGKTYLYINKDIAYKIVVIEDNDLYFNNNNDKSNSPSNSKLDKCNKYYGLEFFNNVNEDIIRKLELYTFQSEKIFYTAFYKENETLIQANYEKPREEHIENFEHILNKLRMSEYESK